jgi:hypothetical protein
LRERSSSTGRSNPFPWKVTGEAIPRAREELRLVAAPVGPGRDVHHPDGAPVLHRVEHARRDRAVVREREEVAAASRAGASVGEDAPELLGVRSRRLAVDGRDERLVGHGLQVEGHETLHGREFGSVV